MATDVNRIEKVTLQLRAIDVLQALKTTRTYEELAALTGIPAGDLNRYVNGHVLPGRERAERVVTEIGYERLRDELRRRLRTDPEGYVDNTDVVFDRGFLGALAPTVAERFGFEPPDAVLTAATDGITLAAAMADHYDARCVYAKQSKETAVDAFLEARERLESGIELTYYLPADALRASDRVLVVDDLIRSGETQSLLLDILAEVGAAPVGVFTLIAAGDEGLRRARRRTDAPVEALVRLD